MELYSGEAFPKAGLGEKMFVSSCVSCERMMIVTSPTCVCHLSWTKGRDRKGH
jgi:hypothetical protein